jgi:hypothetical protein
MHLHVIDLLSCLRVFSGVLPLCLIVFLMLDTAFGNVKDKCRFLFL